MTRALLVTGVALGAALLASTAAQADAPVSKKAAALAAKGHQVQVLAADAANPAPTSANPAPNATEPAPGPANPAPSAAAAAAARARWQRELDGRIGKPPVPVINIHNTWTNERLPVDAATPKAAERVPKELLDRFFRCHFTNQPTDMDPRLFAALVAAANHFEVTRIDIVSGFRSPKYNLILRKKGREVARESQHTIGNAVDFRLPGVSTTRLHAWARRLRLGGVGYYPSSGFVHIDTSRIRYWTGR